MKNLRIRVTLGLSSLALFLFIHIKYFYEYKPLRSLDEIRKDILVLEKQTEGMLKGIIK